MSTLPDFRPMRRLPRNEDALAVPRQTVISQDSSLL